jgi:ribose/xylose/arabinose/galactoside ABC-type transport system permease subunit
MEPNPKMNLEWLLSFSRARGVIVAVFLITILFGLANPFFLTARNIMGLLRAMSSLAIMSLGQLLVIVAGEIDLSVGAIYGLCAMVFGVLWLNGLNAYIAIFIALLVGVGSGGIVSLLVSYARIPSFVATLGIMTAAQGISLLISNARAISPAFMLPPGHEQEIAFFKGLAGFKLPFDLPAQILWMFFLATIIYFLFNKFIFGFRLKAIGGNPEAAHLIRLPVRKYKFFAFGICGLLCGLAGILDFSFIGTTDAGVGISLTFPVFAAVIIGGASLTGGRGSVLGTLFAAGLLAVLSNGLTLIGVGAYAQQIFIGVVTIGAVALDNIERLSKVFKGRKA